MNSLREALAQILEDASMRRAAIRVSREIAAMPTPAAVAEKRARRFG